MTKANRNKLIVILGPTATGKTKLAVKLAGFFNGEIISADSRQVYQGMDIGTGKDLKEFKISNLKFKINIPYHLIDIASPKRRFSLAQYQKLAYQAIDDIIKRNKVPFLVGGSGLYIQAIVDGYQLANVKPDKKLRKHLNMRTLEQLQRLAKKYKILLNQSDWHNKRRLIRALEIKKSKACPEPSRGEPKNQTNQKFKIKNPKYDCLLLGLAFPKKILDQRINQRLKNRLEKQGLIKEVKRLKKQGLSWQKLDNFGLEYRLVAKYLKGELTYKEMEEKLAIAIHQFAKRQMTWFSAHGGSAPARLASQSEAGRSGGKRDKRIVWLDKSAQAAKIINNFLK